MSEQLPEPEAPLVVSTSASKEHFETEWIPGEQLPLVRIPHQQYGQRPWL